MLGSPEASFKIRFVVVIINIYVRAEDIIHTFNFKETQHHHQLAKFSCGER